MVSDPDGDARPEDAMVPDEEDEPSIGGPRAQEAEREASSGGEA